MRKDRQILEHFQRGEKKNTLEHEDNGDMNCSWSIWNGQKRPGKETALIDY